MKNIHLLLMISFMLIPTLSPRTSEAEEKIATFGQKQAHSKRNKLMYTTYFYTAAEAVVHGYQKGSRVKIINLDSGKTVWKGIVNAGETKNVKTGKGVFGFYSDKKASILVGTPSVCNVVGYWFRDQEGAALSKHFFGKIPSAIFNSDERVLIWAWEGASVKVIDRTTQKTAYEGKIGKKGYYELKGEKLRSLLGHTLEVQADKKVGVQVYFDEGFFVPSQDGRTTGRQFLAYVGKITEGKNDLSLIAYYEDAKVKVVDHITKKNIWSGVVKAGSVKTLTLMGRHVHVVSDHEISALVAPYLHFPGGYAEHHYGAGVEGMGIDTDFYLTTPKELWVFSYFNNNTVNVIDVKTNKSIWKGELGAGKYKSMPSTHGYYRVKSSAGISVLGGAAACGAEFSPAGGLFKIDEKIFEALQEIYVTREEEAKKKGVNLTKSQKYGPLDKRENSKVRDYLLKSTGKSMTKDEVEERVDSIQGN